MDDLPTLRAALELEGDFGNGLCFHRSAALCYDLPNSMVCIGIFKPETEAVLMAGGPGSVVPFFHCWVEWQGNVLAPTTIERMGGKLEPMHRLGYYNINGAHNIRKISRSKLLDLFRRNPELLLQLRHGLQPKKSWFSS